MKANPQDCVALAISNLKAAEAHLTEGLSSGAAQTVTQTQALIDLRADVSGLETRMREALVRMAATAPVDWQVQPAPAESTAALGNV